MKKRRVLLLLVGLTAIFVSPAAQASKKSKARVAFESGKHYAHSGLYDQAVEKFEEAVEKDPEYALAYMNLGVCYIQKGEDYYLTARGMLERASRLERGAKDPLVWYNLTVLYTLIEVFDKAYEALDKSLGYGFDQYDALRTDEDLYELRRKSEFRKILEKHKVFL